MNMRKRLLMIIVSIMCVCSNIAIGATDVYAVVQTAAIATTTVNVRKQPTTDSDKLGKLNEGEVIIVVEQRADGWSEVIYKEKKGYIKSEYIVTADVLSMLLGSANAQNVTTSVGSAASNVTKSAGTGAEQPIASVSVGTTVWISATGNCYHSKNNCGRMNPDKAHEMKESDAIANGYSRCSKCW